MNIVITGTSCGIGRARAQTLLEHGHSVWGLARFNQAQYVAEHAGKFFASRCDVSQWVQVERAAAEVAAIWSHVDGLVTCAGIQGEVGCAMTADPLRWSATVRTNLDGTYFAIRAFFAQMARAPRRAKVACFSGGGASKARPNFSAYGVSKTAVVRLVETLAGEWNGRPLDINAVAPGAINTRLTDEVIALGPTVVGHSEHEAAVKQKASGGSSLGKAIEMVEWLLSPASDGVSGKLLSAPWDRWSALEAHAAELSGSDVFTLRRITPIERNLNF
jgi:NAD(P)-dependent dehydrogenase (short-subunit alcohol dehydrogenase family)